MKKQLFNLKMAVIGMGMLFASTASAATFTAVTSGAWSSAATWGGTAPGSNVSNDNIVIPSGFSVDMDMDVTFTGNLIIPNTFNVTGTLTSTSNHGLNMTQGALTGTGMISIKKMWFTNTGTAAFTGTMMVGSMLNSTSALAFSAWASVSDSLILESGTLNLNSTSTIMLASNSVIRVTGGSLSLGSGTFSNTNNYSVLYTGGSKTSGVELSGNSVQNIWVKLNSNNNTVTLANNYVVNGSLSFTNGKMNLNGKHLILKGDLNMSTANAFISNSASDLSIEGSGAMSSSLVFDAGSSIHNMTINRSGSTVKLASALNVDGTLSLMNGNYSLESGANLTMNAGSTIHVEGGNMTANSGSFNGSAAYNVEYMGGSNSSTGLELTGSGMNDLTINYTTNSSKTMLNSNATVGGELKLMNGMLDLNGKNLVLNGTMSQSTTNASFIGNGTSELHLNLAGSSNPMLYFDQSNRTLGKLMVNMSGASTSTVMLGTNLDINNELHFGNGRVVLKDNVLLTVASSGTVTGYDDARYVVTSSAMGNGRLRMNVVAGAADYMTFPVGTMDNYSPAKIYQNTAGTTGAFEVMAKGEVLIDGTTGADMSSNLAMVKRTWHIDAASGTNVNMNLMLGWMAAAEVNGFNRNAAMLRHYTSNAWDVSATSSATAGANSSYWLGRNSITSLSPFAVTDASAPVSVKEQVANTVSFDLYPNPAKETVFVKEATTASYKYEMVDITGRTIFTSVSTDNVNKFDVSKLDKGYYFIKVTNLDNNTAATKRFVKE